MGTRNLVMVTSKGKIKVAQYGQWDGYPTGQGAVIAKFLQDELDLRKFKKHVDALEFADSKFIESTWKDCGADDSGFVTFEIGDLHGIIYPEFSRDTGAEILGLIQTGLFPLAQNEIEFLEEGLYCEYAYDINLDKKTVTIYTGGKKKYTELKFKDFTVDKMKQIESEMNKQS